MLPSGDREHVGVGTTIEDAPGRPAVQDPAFAETRAWAVQASVDWGDHTGLLEEPWEDHWESDESLDITDLQLDDYWADCPYLAGAMDG